MLAKMFNMNVKSLVIQNQQKDYLLDKIKSVSKRIKNKISILIGILILIKVLLRLLI